MSDLSVLMEEGIIPFLRLVPERESIKAGAECYSASLMFAKSISFEETAYFVMLCACYGEGASSIVEERMKKWMGVMPLQSLLGALLRYENLELPRVYEGLKDLMVSGLLKEAKNRDANDGCFLIDLMGFYDAMCIVYKSDTTGYLNMLDLKTLRTKRVDEAFIMNLM